MTATAISGGFYMSRKSSVRFNGKWNLHESYGRKSFLIFFLFWDGYIGCKFNHTQIYGERMQKAGETDDCPKTKKSKGDSIMVDVNIPVTNSHLKELLHQLNVEHTADAQNLALEEIALQAHFLSVVIFSALPKGNGSDIITLKENTTLQLPMLTAEDNRTFYPVFTDWEELRR